MARMTPEEYQAKDEHLAKAKMLETLFSPPGNEPQSDWTPTDFSV